MEDRNNVTEFILLGLSMDKKVQILCFLFFLLCYLAIWLGNLIMISITCSQLITQPMYFFVNYLALSDLFYISTVTPKLTTDLLMGKNFISYKNCMTQLFNTHFFGGGGRIEVFILTAMAYDRYMAICKPLHYATIMNRQRPNSILITSCTRGLLHSLRLFLPAIVLPFCGSNEIDHYFCDAYPLLKLACTDTHKIGFFVIASSDLMGLVSFVVLMASYILIFYNMHTYSAESCHKALSTCSSHISHDPLFPPVIFAYIRSVTTLLEEKVFILFYKIIVPMLNLFIYTLKNMEIGNLCTPVADSCQCMAKPIQYCNVE